MHINKANKSTKRPPQGQTQWQASFSEIVGETVSYLLLPRTFSPPTTLSCLKIFVSLHILRLS